MGRYLPLVVLIAILLGGCGLETIAPAGTGQVETPQPTAADTVRIPIIAAHITPAVP